MAQFLIPLLLGFIFNSASTFTTYYSRRFGERTARVIGILLRDVLGIPMWAIGYVMAVRAPAIRLFQPTYPITALAWLLILAGGVIIIAGLSSLGWRAAAPSVRDTLVDDGIYGHIRHPLYSGMMLELIGLFFLFPTVPVLVACILGILWAVIQARLEEIDLEKRLPAYVDYMNKVPRFSPKLKQ